MNAGLRLKVWAIRLFGLMLAVAGTLLVAQLAALLVWQYAIALDSRAWPQLPLRFLFIDHSELATKSIAPILQFIPEFQWSWIRDQKNPSTLYPVAVWLLDRVHIGLIPALLGALLALKGVVVFMGQRYALASAKRHDQDRVRRIREYRRQQEPGLSVDREVMDDATEVMDERTDFDLIETAERAWRQERMRARR